MLVKRRGGSRELRIVLRRLDEAPSLYPMPFEVANSRKCGFGRITRFWSSSVNLPSLSRIRWMTNITSGRPASYSSNTSAVFGGIESPAPCSP